VRCPRRGLRRSPRGCGGFHAFGILDKLRHDLEPVVGCKVDVVTIRGPFTAKAAEMAQRIEREALEL